MPLTHSEPLDPFWLIGGLPDIKLRQLVTSCLVRAPLFLSNASYFASQERRWQEDTKRYVGESEERSRVELSRALGAQRGEDCARAALALKGALEAAEIE